MEGTAMQVACQHQCAVLQRQSHSHRQRLQELATGEDGNEGLDRVGLLYTLEPLVV